MNRSPFCSISPAPSPDKVNLSIQEPRSVWRLRGSKLIPGTAGETEGLPSNSQNSKPMIRYTTRELGIRVGSAKEASMSEMWEQEKGFEVG